MPKESCHILNWNMRGLNTSALCASCSVVHNLFHMSPRDKTPPSTTTANGTAGTKLVTNIASLLAQLATLCHLASSCGSTRAGALCCIYHSSRVNLPAHCHEQKSDDQTEIWTAPETRRLSTASTRIYTQG